MKICQLNNHPADGPDAEARAFAAGARALVDEGHEVLLVSPEDPSSHIPGKTPRFTRSMVDHGPEETPPAPLFAPDIIHTHQPFLAGEEALRLAAEYHAPLVFTAGHARPRPFPPLPEESASLLAFLDALDVCFANRCDLVIASSPALAVSLFERGVTRPIHVVPDADTPETAAVPARQLLETYTEALRQRRARGPLRECAQTWRRHRELALAWDRVHPSDHARARRLGDASTPLQDGAALTC
jgi:1,2-diacylglycerol 3-alpha-glucosyltransferase